MMLAYSTTIPFEGKEFLSSLPILLREYNLMKHINQLFFFFRIYAYLQPDNFKYIYFTAWYLYLDSRFRSNMKTIIFSPVFVHISECILVTSQPVISKTILPNKAIPLSNNSTRVFFISLAPSEVFANCYSAGVRTPLSRIKMASFMI